MHEATAWLLQPSLCNLLGGCKVLLHKSVQPLQHCCWTLWALHSVSSPLSSLHTLKFWLAGMGCSAGVIAIGLAQKLLATQPQSYALVVSLETVTQNW